MRSDTGYARLQTVTSFNMATSSSSSNNGMTTLWRQRLRPWPRRYPTFKLILPNSDKTELSCVLHPRQKENTVLFKACNVTLQLTLQIFA